MRRGHWAIARTHARAGVVAGIAGVIAVTAFALCALPGFAAATATSGLRSLLTSAPAAARAVVVSAPADIDDPDGQQRRAAQFWSTALAGSPVVIEAGIDTAPVAITATSAGPGRTPTGEPELRLGHVPAVGQHARLFAGRWPDDTGTALEIALPAAAARDLGLEVDAALTLDDKTFRVVGLWDPVASNDPLLTVDPRADRTSGSTVNLLGLGLVGERVALTLHSPEATWTITADPTTITLDDVDALAGGLAQLPKSAHIGLGPDGAQVTGDLGATLATVAASRRAADTISAVPLLLVGTVSLVMLIQLSRLLALDRRSEVALIRSRGASAGQLVGAATAEATAVAVPAAAVGVAGAAALLASVGGSLGRSWSIGIAVVLGAVLVITAPAAHQARRSADRQEIDNSGRVRALAAGSTVVLLVAAAAVALWRFRRTGSAVVTDADGATHVDPIAAMAPALTLIAAAVIAAGVFGAGALALEHAAARWRRGPGTVLAARQVARRSALFGVAVLMTALAVGGTGLAAGFAGTQARTQQVTDVLRNSAPVRVGLPARDPVLAGPYDPGPGSLAALPEVGAASMALRAPAEVGALPVTLTGVDAGALSSYLPSSGGFDPRAVGAAIAGTTTMPALPDGVTGLTLSLQVAAAWRMEPATTLTADGQQVTGPAPSGPAGQRTDLAVTTWIAAPDGALQPVAVGRISVPIARAGDGTPTAVGLEVPLPDLVAGSRVAALDVTQSLVTDPVAVDLTVSRILVDGGRPLALDAPWAITPTGDQSVAFAASPGVLGWSGTYPATRQYTVRLTPQVSDPTLPVAISRELADAAQLGVGALITVGLDSARTFPARVTVVSPVLPGDDDSADVLADLTNLSAALLRSTADLPAVTDVWVSPVRGTALDAVAKAVRAAVPAAATVEVADTRSASALLRPAASAMWFGAAGALLLAAIGVGCVIAILSRERADELVVLRAVGLSSRRQARARRRELFSVAVAGWLLGIVVAIVAVSATVSGLAGSTIVDPLGVPAAISLDVLPALILMAGNVVAVAVLIVVHGGRVRARVAASTPTAVNR